MKIKTRELEGMALCYTLCMIEMPHLVWGETIGMHHASWQIVVPELPGSKCYSPFMSWETFGPIIEDNAIITTFDRGYDFDQPWRCSLSIDTYNLYEGPTPLIAAMRCFVASRLGDEVEVPDKWE